MVTRPLFGRARILQLIWLSVKESVKLGPRTVSVRSTRTREQNDVCAIGFLLPNCGLPRTSSVRRSGFRQPRNVSGFAPVSRPA